jgi:hypothetical protein
MEPTVFDHLENGHFLTHRRQNPTFYPTLWVKRRLPPNRIASEPTKPRQVFGEFSILAKSPVRGCRPSGSATSRRASGLTGIGASGNAPAPYFERYLNT